MNNNNTFFTDIIALIEANISNIECICSVVDDYINRELSEYLKTIDVIVESVSLQDQPFTLTSMSNNTFTVSLDVNFTLGCVYHTEEIHLFFDKYVTNEQLRSYTINSIIQ